MNAAAVSRFHSPISAASRHRSASRRSMSSSRRSIRLGRFAMSESVGPPSDGLPARRRSGVQRAGPRAKASRQDRGMAAIAFALGSSLVWGCADFFGGVLSRRLALAGVTIVSQGAGFAALLLWLAGDGFHLDGRAFGLGLLAGIGGGVGLACFYRALAVGTMSVVSPVAACG